MALRMVIMRPAPTTLTHNGPSMWLRHESITAAPAITEAPIIVTATATPAPTTAEDGGKSYFTVAYKKPLPLVGAFS